MTRHDEKRMSPFGRRVGEGARFSRRMHVGAMTVGVVLLVAFGAGSLLVSGVWSAVLTTCFVITLGLVVAGVR